MGGKGQLQPRFNHVFADWGTELPSDALSPGVVWLIVQRGWTIWTRFDIGDEDGRERLDYYAMHRMTGDRHVRMYTDGEQEFLHAIAECYVIPQGATAAEEKEARDKHHVYNQAVEKLLEAKGFVMTDHAHPSASLNRYLQTHSDEEDGHRWGPRPAPCCPCRHSPLDGRRAAGPSLRVNGVALRPRRRPRETG